MDPVVVVGGGIAGPAVALALHRAGIAAEVYEAQPRGDGDAGAFLTLATNGMLALAALGVAESVAAVGFPLRRLRLLDATGTQVHAGPMGRDGDLTRYRCLRRAELAEVLRAEVTRRGIPLYHGARLASVRDDGTGVTAAFRDGRTVRGRLLVGADGANSTVRAAVAPDAVPEYAGQQVFYGYTRSAPPLPGPDTFHMIRGTGAAFGCATSPAGETYWFARVTGPSVRYGRADLLPLLRADRTPAAGIVAGTDDVMVTDARELPPGMPWWAGRTLLVGDAAHVAAPATGQGASMAVEDAVILAKSLRDTTDPGAALTTYERYRRPRTAYNILASGRMTRGLPPEGTAPVGDEELARQLDWHVPLRGRQP